MPTVVTASRAMATALRSVIPEYRVEYPVSSARAVPLLRCEFLQHSAHNFATLMLHVGTSHYLGFVLSNGDVASPGACMPIHARTSQPPLPPIDGIFRALSDPTRRRVLERLGRSPASVSDLAAPFEVAMPSFLEHLRVLETAGLVRSRKSGRVRTYQLTPKRLKVAEEWLSRQRTTWEQRFDQLDAYLLQLDSKERP